MARRRPQSRRVERARCDRGESRSAARTDDFLGRSSGALAVIAVAECSLGSKEILGTGDEVVALRYGLSLLRAAYSGLDLASRSTRRTSRGVR